MFQFMLYTWCLWHTVSSRRITPSAAMGDVATSSDNDLDNTIGPNPHSNNFRDGEWVKISEPPMPVFSRKVGGHVELHCEAMGSPPPAIQWYKRNMRLTQNTIVSNMIEDGANGAGLAKVSSRLVINYLLPRHEDLYRCVAESGAQVATAVTKIIVLNKAGREMNFTQLINSKILGAHHVPRVTFWATTYMDIIGSDVILPCTTVGNPKPTLSWMDPNDKPVENDDPRVQVLPNGELQIRSITWDDMGVYNCVVDNLVGRDKVETFLYPMQDSK